MGDDQKEEIASLKGKYEALETVAIEKNCGFAGELLEAREERGKLEAEKKKKDSKN